MSEIETKNSMVLILACLGVICTQAGIAMYSPSLPFLGKILKADYHYIAYTLTAYVFGYGVAMLCIGGLSDQLGRRKTYLITSGIFSVTSLVLIYMQSIYLFIFLRLLQGIGGGGCAVIARSSVRDIYEGKRLVSAMSYISLAFNVSMGFFQYVGGVIQTYANYQYDFICMSILGCLIFIIVYFMFEETYHVNKHISLSELIQSYWYVIKEKSVVIYGIGGGIGYSISLMFNILGIYYLHDVLEISPKIIGSIGFYFSLAYLFGSIVVTRLIKIIEIDSLINVGRFLILGSALLVFISIIITTSSAIMIILPILIGLIGQAILYPCAMTKGLEPYKASPGVSSSLFGFTQQLSGFCVTAIAGCLPYQSLYSLAVMMIFIGSISFILLSKPVLSSV